MKECPECWSCLPDAAGACARHPSERLEQLFEGEGLIDGKYRLERRLGSGGMGVVYRARHVGLDRPFAVKLIRSPHLPHAGGGSFAERFRVEARALGLLKHPHVVTVTDYGVDARDGGLPYLVMECLEGRTLREIALAEGGLPFERALPLLEAIARAVDYAHGRGVLHRDLKPGNVLVSENSRGAPAVKILDFGLARLAGRGEARGPAGAAPGPPPARPMLTERGGVAGTPAYMAPELARGGSASPASDIYSFGVLAYEVLVGRPPFHGTLPEIRAAHLLAAPPRPSALQRGLPVELDGPLASALQKDPDDRPACAADVVQALRAAWSRARKRRWRTRGVPLRIGLAALVAALAAALGGALGSWPPAAALERRMLDARFAWSPSRPPDDRIVIVSIDDASLDADPTPLAGRADAFGRALERIVAAGARGVAVDLLLPRHWSRSEAFSRLVLAHHPRLALAALATPSGDTIGTECIDGLTAVALGEHAAAVFGLINVGEDPDGVIRRARSAFPDVDGLPRESLAARAARLLAGAAAPSVPSPFWIDYRLDAARLRTLSWRDLARALREEPSPFQDRLVLVGASFVASGDDAHRHPRSAARISGLVVQALIVNTLITGAPLRDAPRLASTLAIALEALLAAAALLVLPRAGRAAAVAAGLGALHAAAAAALFQGAGIVLPVAAPLLALMLAAAAGALIRSARPHGPGAGA